MGEHDHLSNSQLQDEINSRLDRGEPVGRLINSTVDRGVSTSEFQSRRTTADVAAHVRWKSYLGQAAPAESAELARRSSCASQTGSNAEHNNLSTEQIHTEILRRLDKRKPVGRLINSLRGRGVATNQYQSRRTITDIEAHIRWKSALGMVAKEEREEISRRRSQELPKRMTPFQSAPLTSAPSLLRPEKSASFVQKKVETQFYDVFISHASDDKDAIVRQLANALRADGLLVWYDEFELRIGDSLRRKIDRGIANSRFGIVVCSQAFFSKGWANYELDGIVTKAGSGEQVLLPIWHNVSKDEVIKYSPSLADKLARSTATHTIEEISSEIVGLIKGSDQVVSDVVQEKSKSRVNKRRWWKFWQ